MNSEFSGKFSEGFSVRMIPSFGRRIVLQKTEVSFGRLRQRGLHKSQQSDEIRISSVMTYWWESTRDLIAQCRRLFPRSRIILGGIYPTLAAQHAARYCKPDVVVMGEVPDPNDLWTDCPSTNRRRRIRSSPPTGIYQQWLPWFKERNCHTRLESLNGKLYLFIETNGKSLVDYVDLQRLMFTLYQHFRSKSFQILGESCVSEAFLHNVRNGFEDFVRFHRDQLPGEALDQTRERHSASLGQIPIETIPRSTLLSTPDTERSLRLTHQPEPTPKV